MNMFRFTDINVHELEYGIKISMEYYVNSLDDLDEIRKTVN